jgi:PAS domain S-box-containing protein
MRKFWAKLAGWGQALTTPSPSLTDPISRLQATILLQIYWAAVLYFFLVFALYHSLYYIFTRELKPSANHYYDLDRYLLIMATLALSTVALRRGYIRLTLLLSTLVLSFLFISLVFSQDTRRLDLLMPMAIPLLVSSIFLRRRLTIFLGLAQTLLVLAGVLWTNLSINYLLGFLLFLWFGIIMMLVVRGYFRRFDQLNRAQLERSERNYRNIFESSLAGFVVTDGQQVLYGNQRAAFILGYDKPEALKNLNFSVFMHPEDLPIVMERAQKRFQDPHSVPADYEVRIVRPRTNEIRWVQVNPRVTEIDGQLTTTVLLIDITERKNAYDYRLQFDKIITSLSTRFANLKPELLDANINYALQVVGEFTGVNYASVFLREGEDYFNHTHEWSKSGRHSQRGQQQELRIADYPTWQSQILAGEPVIISNLATAALEPAEFQAYAKLGLAACIKVPIVYQQQVLGMISLDDSQPRTWNDDLIILLRILGEIIAVALKRKADSLELLQRTYYLETLNTLAGITTSTLALDALLGKISKLLVKTFEVSRSALFFQEQEAEEVLVSYRLRAEYTNQRAFFSENWAGRETVFHPQTLSHNLLTWRQAMHALHVYQRDEANLPEALQHYLDRYACQTLVRLPLFAASGIFGFVELWSLEKRLFTPAELDLLQAIISQAVVAINRARLYEALRESEARNNAILNSMPDMVFRLNQDGVYTEMHYAKHEDLVIDPEKIIHRRVDELLPAPVAERVMQALRQTLETHTMQVFEYDLLLRDQKRYYECRMVAADSQSVFTFIRNISERQVAQQREMELALERERGNMLEKFISDASHDLRTPIANLKSRLFLLRRATTPEKREAQFSVMEAQIERLEHLIDDMLTMSRLEYEPTRYDRFNLNVVLRELGGAFQAAAQEKGLLLQLQLTPLPDMVGDSTEINRLFSNLISNAIQYTQKGEIIITSRLDADGLQQVSVSDTGIGISSEDMGRIFERFYRGDQARQSVTGGTGLGLAIVKKIVELHRGRVEVTSQPAGGTTFTVWLPTQGR